MSLPSDRLAALPTKVEIYDTTLRDGSQTEGMSLTVDDKLRIAEQLDHLGVQWIEGGWPGANPKDDEFFRRAATELALTTSTLVAFGSTRRAGVMAGDDEVLRNLVAAGTDTVCIVGKSARYHVLETLQISLDEAEAMVADSIGFLKGSGLRTFFDAEHFFDGWQEDREFSLRVSSAAVDAGADALVLCDTNGGTLPHEAEAIVAEVVQRFGASTVIAGHFHDDSGCGVANALAAVRAGATQIQGCLNGYGERTGNANLTTVIPTLTLKMGVETIPADRMER
ncbi:MAG TPA: citramalate synthase, partial [Acidimicrobiales bacterium]|nr:citramalate synthase [Acidimicrobiales bacterium]